MSEVLEVTERKAGVEYHREDTKDATGVSGVGAWNADVSPSHLGKFDFSEIKNLRQVQMGSLTVRTPPKLYPLSTIDDNGGNHPPTVLAKCQYRANFQGLNTALTPAPFVFNDCQIDITLFWFNENYYLALVAPNTGGPATINDVAPATVWTVNLSTLSGGIPATPAPLTGWIIQYGLGLVITIQGNAPGTPPAAVGQSDGSGGTWTCYPILSGTPPVFSSASLWQITSLGKDVCPTPKTYSVVQECQGDLLVINNSGGVRGDGVSPIPFSTFITIDPSNPPNPQLIRLPLNCNYWLNAGTTMGAAGLGNGNNNDPRWWVHGPQDPGPNPNFSPRHDMSRAWGYRFVLVLQYSDPEGGTYQVRSQPSVDFWVPDFTYGPAQWGPQPIGGVYPNAASIDFCPFLDEGPQGVNYDGGDSPGFEWFSIANGATFFINSSSTTTCSPLPSLSEMSALQKLVQQSIAPEAIGNPNAGGVGAPYEWLAEYFMWVQPFSNATFEGQAPYLVDVPISLLLNCPNIIFNSLDFGLQQLVPNGAWTIPGIQGTVIGIELYRTSHGQPLDTDNVKSVFGQIDASFAPDTMGYIGTIQPGQTFTDNIIDDAIAFGTDPMQYEGLLRGQFSGNVISEYADSIIIGDIIEDYEVLAPASTLEIFHAGVVGGAPLNIILPLTPDGQSPTRFSSILECYWYPVITGGYPDADVNFTAPNGEPRIQFFAAYQDLNGYVSSPVQIAWRSPFLVTSPLWNASFTLPRGYDPSIQAVVLYRRYWNGTNFLVTQIATVQCNTGYYISANTLAESSNLLATEAPTTPPTQASIFSGLPSGQNLRSEDNGEIIWSASGQEFSWPATNFWVAHSFAHVTGLEAITGPLWVLTDQSVHLTNLEDRYEDETMYVGAISRFGVQKINKVVMFLSASGLYFAEASGVRSVPHSIHTLLLQYLQEQIPGQLTLANVRRASLGWLPERFEMWVYIPSSKDLGGGLPHLLAILRFQASGNVREARWLDSIDFLSSITCYQFDFTKDFALTDLIVATGQAGTTDGSNTFSDPNYSGFVSGSVGQTITIFGDGVTEQFTITGIASTSSVTVNAPIPTGTNQIWFLSNAPTQSIPAVLNPNSFRSDIVIFNSHVDGGMFASYFDLAQGQMYVVDNDCGLLTWTGNTALEKYWPMGEPLLMKAMTEVALRVDGDFAMTIANGQQDSSGNYTATFGHLDRRAKLSNVIDNRSPMRKRISGSSWETTSTAPITRMVTIPDANGNHSVVYESIALDVAPVHNHP